MNDAFLWAFTVRFDIITLLPINSEALTHHVSKRPYRIRRKTQALHDPIAKRAVLQWARTGVAGELSLEQSFTTEKIGPFAVVVRRYAEEEGDSGSKD